MNILDTTNERTSRSEEIIYNAKQNKTIEKRNYVKEKVSDMEYRMEMSYLCQIWIRKR